MLKARHMAMLLIMGSGSWLGLRVYTYFFDKSIPKLHITGLYNGQHYAGDVQCFIACDKSGYISIWLDEQPLTNKFSIRAYDEEHSFVIPTKTLVNGTHSLKTEFTDATFHKNKIIIEREFYVDNAPLQAAFIQSSSYKVFQGRTLHVQFQVNKEIESAKLNALAYTYECHQETKNALVYECFVPIPCKEQPNEYLVSLDVVDNVGNTVHLDNKFQVVFYPFKKEMLRVKNEKMEKEKELGKDNKLLQEELLKIIRNSPKEKLWRGAFCTPIDIQRITCEFGTIRTTQHKGRYAHKALDIINTPKSVVWAPQDGVVVLKDRFALSGNTIIIDHGLGVVSLFFHLNDFADIGVGQKVVQGNPLGTIGKTGYTTGYHLHWEMRVNNISVDPMQWTKTTF